METLLGALTGAADHTQFALAWQRLADHFDTLFTTEDSIDQLKQAIRMRPAASSLTFLADSGNC